MTPAPSGEYGTVSSSVGLRLKARFMNWVSPLPCAKSFMSPEVEVTVASLPNSTPKYGERNWVKFKAGRATLVPLGSG